MKAAKLIVIEGGDHIGKSTITNNIVGSLNANKNINAEYIHYPGDDDAIQEYLNGNPEELNPLDAAMLFANDRWLQIHHLRAAILNNDYVILDRYVYSNVLYQCGRLYLSTHDVKSTLTLAEQIIDFEFDLNHLPKPDMTFFIQREPVVTPSNVDDILESDADLQEFINDNCDNIFFDKKHYGKFGVIDADFLTNLEVEEIIEGAIINAKPIQ